MSFFGTLGKIGTGALTGFMTGGPLGAVLGGAAGGFMKGGFNPRNMLLSGLGGLGGGLVGRGLTGIAGGFMGEGGLGGMMQGFGGGLTGLFQRPGMAGMGQTAGGAAFPGMGSQMGMGAAPQRFNLGIGNIFGQGQGQFGGGLLPSLMGQGGLPGALGAGLGFMQQRKAGQRLGQLQDMQLSMLGQARDIAGISPEARALTLGRAREGLRSSQAERGIYESGIGAQMEAQQMPLIEEQLRQQQLNAMLGIASGYNPLLQSQGQMFGGF